MNRSVVIFALQHKRQILGVKVILKCDVCDIFNNQNIVLHYLFSFSFLHQFSINSGTKDKLEHCIVHRYFYFNLCVLGVTNPYLSNLHQFDPIFVFCTK
jgi:nucleoside recognition membrane protein YjiH